MTCEQFQAMKGLGRMPTMSEAAAMILHICECRPCNDMAKAAEDALGPRGHELAERMTRRMMPDFVRFLKNDPEAI